MPGLLRGVARTAVVAGTATAVSNRVSRRQYGRWADKDQQAYEEQQAQAYQAQQATQAQAGGTDDDMEAKIAQLQKLATLKEQGVLSDEEFQQAKAKILNS